MSFGDPVSKLRILVLTSTFPRWKDDVEPPFVYELSRRLATWFNVKALAPHATGSDTRESMDGILVHRFRYAPGTWQRIAYHGGILANLKKSPVLVALVPFFLAAQLLAVFRLLRRCRIKIIHAHWIFPQGIVAVVARGLAGSRAKVLCTCHGGDIYGLKGSFFSWIKRMVAVRCDHLSVVSHSMRDELIKLGIDPGKISVIPMGVDLLHRFVPPREPLQSPSLLFVGRLVEKKGLRYLLEAMPAITERFPESHLTVAGDGPERFELEKLSDKLGLRGHVEFLGALRQDELALAYQRASIVVFPSVVGDDGDREGFGLVLVEAMGCGCAVVSTDLPAMTDIVKHAKTGIVVPEKRPGEIAAAVIRLLSNLEFKSAIAFEGRRHVLRNFEWGAIAKQYRDLLLSIESQHRFKTG